MANTALTHRVFNDQLVLPGDIVLTTTPDRQSRMIRTFIGADISHAMICVDHASVIDSTGDGVHARNLRRIVLEPGCAGHVLRPKTPLTPEQLRDVIDFARQQVGTRYSVMGAGKSVAIPGVVGRRQFCSRLVAQAFRHAGILLSPNADFCHPGELLNSALLDEVADVLIEVAPEEAKAIKDDTDTVRAMRDATNALLNAAREVSSRIESLNDIDAYLIEHPEADEPFATALEQSGYLVLWRQSLIQTPWQYDLEAMEARAELADDLREYCAELCAGEQRGPNRFVVNRAGYVMRASVYGCRYFSLMAELHTRLAELHAQRVKVARDWLMRRGVNAPAPAPLLRPHTPEWFDSLRQWDPRQAAIVEATVNAAGSADGCSVCADTPASDYVLEAMPPAGPGTIRLCDDCFRIRSPGEPMRPLPSAG